MNEDLKGLLAQELSLLSDAGKALKYSYEKCGPLVGKGHLSLDEQEHFEALTARFARLSDLLIQKVFRVIDEIELEGPGTVLDRLNRAEKRGLISQASDFVEIRRLRNRITHEYVPDAVEDVFAKCYGLVPQLLESVRQTGEFCARQFGVA